MLWSARANRSQSGTASPGVPRDSDGPEAIDVIHPQREGHEAPQLAAVILAPRDVIVEQPAHRAWFEVALGPGPGRGEEVAGQGLQLAAQPGGGRNREAPLARRDDALRDQRGHGL